MKTISLRTVAAAAGVSVATASRALSNSSLVPAETRRRVIAAARELGYAPEPRQGGWRVGVIVEMEPHSINGYYANTLAALCSEIAKRDCRTELVLANELESFDERAVRGAIDLTTHEDLPERWLRGFSLPLVRINGNSQRLHHIGAVIEDGAAASRRAVELLWRNGHRRIGFFSLEGRVREIEKASRRWLGFLEALRGHGVAEPERFAIFPKGVLAEKLTAALRQGMTALICPNEYLALRLEPVLHQLGIRVPRDLSLVEWECPGVSAYLQPPRTTLQENYNRLAFEAMEMLTAMIRRRPTPPDVILPMTLIERESIFDRRAYEEAHVEEQLPPLLERRILVRLRGGEASRSELAGQLGVAPNSGAFLRSLRRLRNRGAIEFTHPEHPRSPAQRFRLAPKQ